VETRKHRVAVTALQTLITGGLAFTAANLINQNAWAREPECCGVSSLSCQMVVLGPCPTSGCSGIISMGGEEFTVDTCCVGTICC
jgi:hypothetical protein